MRNKFLHLLLITQLILISLVGTTALMAKEKTPQPTIAVLGTTSELSDLCAIVEAGLFQEGIVLVERAKIEKILQEQKLTAAGLVDRDNLLKLGQLIRADGFLLISVEEVKKEEKNIENPENPKEKALTLLRIRLIDTAHGLRFLDTFEEWDNTKLKETTERITENISEIASKLILPPDKAIPIGIVGIHRVELDERYQWLTRALPTMLSARLNKEPRIIMLEREDLKMLLEEKQLTQGKDTAFWGSAVLIDGYLQRTGKEKIELKLQLKNFSGGEIATFTTSINPEESLGTINKMATDIIRKLLKSSPSTSWQPQKEAEEFFRQGDLLRKNGRHKDAIEPLETAYALQPDNITYTGALFENEWKVRFKNSSLVSDYPISCPYQKETGIFYYSNLELACIVSRLVRQIKVGYENSYLSVNDVFEWEKLIGRGGIANAGYLINFASTSTQEVKDINLENRRIWVEFMRKIIKSNPDNYWSKYYIVDMAYINSDDSHGLAKDMEDTVTEFCVLPEEGGKTQSNDERYELCRYVLADQDEKYLQELSEIEDPLVKFLSYRMLSKPRFNQSQTDRKQYFKKMLDILLNELKSPNEPFSESVKKDIRLRIMADISSSDITYDERISTYEKLFEPLIGNKDCKNLYLWLSLIFTPYPTNLDMAERYIRLLEGIEQVMHNCEKNNNTLTILQKITDARDLITHRFPELKPYKKISTHKINVAGLLKRESWPQNKYFNYSFFTSSKVLLKDKMLWIAFEEPGFILAGINLQTKRIISLCQANYNLKASKILTSIPLITGIAINENANYIAVRDKGLIEFPGSSITGVKLIENPKILTEKDGLPSISITGIAGNEDKLWIAYGGMGKESGLGVYTPKTGHWETIFCSTLKKYDTPFNSGKPYVISNLTFSTKRDKLFFIVGENWGEFDEMNPRWGLWKIDINNKKPVFIWNKEEIKGHRSNIREIIDSGNKWWLKLAYGLMEFDPNSEKVKSMLGYEPKSELDVNSSFFGDKIPSFFYYSFGSTVIHNNRLWGRLGNSQIISIYKDSRGIEDALIFDNDILDGEKVLDFFSTPYGLIAIGNGTIGLIETDNIDTKK